MNITFEEGSLGHKWSENFQFWYTHKYAEGKNSYITILPGTNVKESSVVRM